MTCLSDDFHIGGLGVADEKAAKQPGVFKESWRQFLLTFLIRCKDIFRLKKKKEAKT